MVSLCGTSLVSALSRLCVSTGSDHSVLLHTCFRLCLSFFIYMCWFVLGWTQAGPLLDLGFLMSGQPLYSNFTSGFSVYPDSHLLLIEGAGWSLLWFPFLEKCLEALKGVSRPSSQRSEVILPFTVWCPVSPSVPFPSSWNNLLYICGLYADADV